jgi:hypothetical protein
MNNSKCKWRNIKNEPFPLRKFIERTRSPPKDAKFNPTKPLIQGVDDLRSLSRWQAVALFGFSAISIRIEIKVYDGLLFINFLGTFVYILQTPL